MVRDYVTDLYEPTAERVEGLAADGFARARALSGWKARVTDAWPDVRVVDVEADAAGVDVGTEREVTATVALGRLAAEDVRVELLHGSVARGDELVDPTVVPLSPAGGDEGGDVTRFRGTISCERSGRYGFTLRVVPAGTDVVTPLELGLVAWA
jgi:starch phosphorylase